MDKKKKIRLIGNAVTAAAIIFIVKKVMDMELDLKEFASAEIITALTAAVLVQTVTVVFGCYPWLLFIRVLSGREIPFSAAMPVYTKSNMYKYIPGNVFQYVGRNTLAADMDISHVDVACATVMDIIFGVVYKVIIGAVLLQSYIGMLLDRYLTAFVTIAAVCIAAAAVLFILLFARFREQLYSYIHRYKAAFSGKGRKNTVRGALYYLGVDAAMSAVYFLSARLMFGYDTKTLLTVTGAYVFSCFIGYITPGAPGGIGIRESVMLFICGSAAENDAVFFVLAFRVVSVISDMLAFLAGTGYGMYVKKQLIKGNAAEQNIGKGEHDS